MAKPSQFRRPVSLLVCLAFLTAASAVSAQQPSASKNPEAAQALSAPDASESSGPLPASVVPSLPVPRLIKFSGSATDSAGRPRAGVVGITFAIYAAQYGGAPLWIETQNVSPDTQGNYSVLLGSTQSQGVPLEIFTAGDPRWVGVSVSLPGEVEQPRVLLVSVPYALKASDADTLGGQPLSAFVLTNNANGALSNSAKSTTNTNATSKGTVTQVDSGPGLTGGPITTTGTLSLDTSFTDARYLQPNGNGSHLTGVNAVTLNALPSSAFAQLAVPTNLFTGGATFGNTVTAPLFSGSGAGLFGVNAASLGGLAPSGFVQVGTSANPVTQTLSGALNLHGNLTLTPLNGVNPTFTVTDADGSSFSVGDAVTVQSSNGAGGIISPGGNGLDIQGSTNQFGTGSSIDITGGAGGATRANNGGSVDINGGNAPAPDGSGGDVNLNAGNGGSTGSAASGGNINLVPGHSATKNGVVNVFGDLQIAEGGFISFSDGSTINTGAGSGNTGGGTITGVTAGTGLTGGGTSGNVVLGINPSVVPTLGGNNTYNGNQDIQGNLTLTNSNGQPTLTINGTSGMIALGNGTSTTTDNAPGGTAQSNTCTGSSCTAASDQAMCPVGATCSNMTATNSVCNSGGCTAASDQAMCPVGATCGNMTATNSVAMCPVGAMCTNMTATHAVCTGDNCTAASNQAMCSVGATCSNNTATNSLVTCPVGATCSNTTATNSVATCPVGATCTNMTATNSVCNGPSCEATRSQSSGNGSTALDVQNTCNSATSTCGATTAASVTCIDAASSGCTPLAINNNGTGNVLIATHGTGTSVATLFELNTTGDATVSHSLTSPTVNASQLCVSSVCTSTLPTGSSLTATTPLAISSGNISLNTVPVNLGGTGSSTQNFVDLSNIQTIGGAKTFTGNIGAPSAAITSLTSSAINALSLVTPSVGNSGPLTITGSPVALTATSDITLTAISGSLSLTGDHMTLGPSSNTPGTISLASNTTLLPSCTATVAAGCASAAIGSQASAFNSATSSAVPLTLQLQAQPVGSNTANPSAQLSLNFGSGTTTPAPTGLTLSSGGDLAANSVSTQSLCLGLVCNTTWPTAGGGINLAGSNGVVVSPSPCTGGSCIVSLGTVAIANGGTGITSGPTAAGQFLRSTGANTWSLGTIQSSDLPSPLAISGQVFASSFTGDCTGCTNVQNSVNAQTANTALSALNSNAVGGTLLSGLIQTNPSTPQTISNSLSIGSSISLSAANGSIGASAVSTSVVAGAGSGGGLALYADSNNPSAGGSVLLSDSPTQGITLNGNTGASGNLSLAATGTANTTTGFSSNRFALNTSVADASGTPQLVTLGVRADPTGNNTSSSGAKFDWVSARNGGSLIPTGAATDTNGNWIGNGFIDSVTGIDRGLPLGCTSGQTTSYNQTTATWGCANASGGGSVSVTAGTGITVTGTTSNQIVNVDSSQVPLFGNSLNTFPNAVIVGGPLTVNSITSPDFSISSSGNIVANGIQATNITSPAISLTATGGSIGTPANPVNVTATSLTANSISAVSINDTGSFSTTGAISANGGVSTNNLSAISPTGNITVNSPVSVGSSITLSAANGSIGASTVSTPVVVGAGSGGGLTLYADSNNPSAGGSVLLSDSPTQGITLNGNAGASGDFSLAATGTANSTQSFGSNRVIFPGSGFSTIGGGTAQSTAYALSTTTQGGNTTAPLNFGLSFTNNQGSTPLAPTGLLFDEFGHVTTTGVKDATTGHTISLPATCASGQGTTFNGSGWGCATLSGGTSVAASAPITATVANGTTTIGLQTCTSGFVLVAVGTSYVCAQGAIDIATSTNLVGGGNTFLGSTATLDVNCSNVVCDGNTASTLTGSLRVVAGVSSGAGLQAGATQFALLPACTATTEGSMRPITDSTVNTWGSNASGGGTLHVLAYCNGSSWTVMAK